MQFCSDHWTALRTAIEVRGLGHLIAANGRDALARTAAELAGRDEPADYDPLLAAHWMIVGRATQVFGLAAFGEGCPVCVLLHVTPPPPDGHRYPTNDHYFIDGPADAVLAVCRELGIAEASPGPEDL